VQRNDQDNGKRKSRAAKSDFLDSLWKGALLGALVLAVALPVMRWRQHQPATPQTQQPPVASAPQISQPAAPKSAPVLHAQFGEHEPSNDARLMANWVLQSRDNADMSFVVVDKKDARVYVFDNTGHLKADSAALLGQAVGDDSVPGIGEKPLKEVKLEEKTTPAGRFIAEIGENAGHEDVVWVSYDLAVSMHRVRPLVKAERRLERLASPTPEDNRISFGCINLPPPFYENVLKPTVQAGKTVVYVLPETRPLQAQFAGYHDPDLVAGALALR
jgi:hypothetical protein